MKQAGLYPRKVGLHIAVVDRSMQRLIQVYCWFCRKLLELLYYYLFAVNSFKALNRTEVKNNHSNTRTPL